MLKRLKILPRSASDPIAMAPRAADVALAPARDFLPPDEWDKTATPLADAGSDVWFPPRRKMGNPENGWAMETRLGLSADV